MPAQMNRTIAPKVQLPHSLSLGHMHEETLSNGLKVYTLDGTSQNILQLNILMPGGRFFEKKRMLAGLCASTMLKGTNSKSAREIAETFDFYGATIKIQANMYSAQVSLFCLSDKFAELLPLLMDVLQNAQFPEKEIEKIKRKSKQKLAVQWEKNSYIATQYFNRAIFGAEHPFGYLSDAKDIDAINREDLLQHYMEGLHLNSKSIVLAAGNIGATIHKLISDSFSKLSLHSGDEHQANIQPQEPDFKEIASKNALQSAIRIGMPSINIYHKDFENLQILNTVLGGYFGSRLMSNIREEKGYTYGIYSFLNPIMDTGYFCIATEVGNQYKNATISEIEKEINRLKNEEIPAAELAMVKNYMIGQIMKSADGPLSMISTLKNFVIFGLDLDVLNKQLENIHAIDAKQLQELAQQYLNFDKMTKIVAG